MSAFLHELLVLKRGIIIVFSWAMISCPIIVDTGPTKSKHHKPYEYRNLFYKLQNVVLLQLNSNKSTPTTCLVVLSPTPFPHHRHVFLRTGNLLQYDKPCCVIVKITTRWYLQKKIGRIFLDHTVPALTSMHYCNKHIVDLLLYHCFH